MSWGYGAGTVCVSECVFIMEMWYSQIVHIYRCISENLKVQEQSALTTLSAVASCARVRSDLMSYLRLASGLSPTRKEIIQQNVHIDIKKLTVTSPFSKNRTEKRGNEILKSFTNTLWFCIKSLKCSVFLIPVSWCTLPYRIACRSNYGRVFLQITNVCATTDTNILRPFTITDIQHRMFSLQSCFAFSNVNISCLKVRQNFSAALLNRHGPFSRNNLQNPVWCSWTATKDCSLSLVEYFTQWNNPIT